MEMDIISTGFWQETGNADVRKVEEQSPKEALSLYRRLSRQNTKYSNWIFMSGPLFAMLGFKVTSHLSQVIHLNKFVIMLLFGVTAFLPPFYLHTRQKLKSLRLKRQSPSKIGSTLFMFALVFLTPIGVIFPVILGVLVLAGPFVLAVQFIVNQPFEVMPKWYGLPFVIPAALIVTAYFVSPNRRFSAPFPLSTLFRDALTALWLGFWKFLAIFVGTMLWLSFRSVWEDGFNQMSFGICGMTGFISGLLLHHLEIDMKLGNQIKLGRARVLTRLGRKFQARYWLSEAFPLLDENTPEETAKEFEELVDKLGLKM